MTTTTTTPRHTNVANQLSPLHVLISMVVESARHNAAAARVWAVFCALGLAIVWPLEWRYDMLPTLQWFQTHGAAIQVTMIATYGQVLGSSLLLIMPLVLKGVTAQWLDRWMLGSLFLAAELFDVMTNWDAAWELFASFFPTWQPVAFAAEPLVFLQYWGAFILILVVTTSVFQVVAVGLGFCLLVALWNSFQSRLARVGALAVVAVVVLMVMG